MNDAPKTHYLNSDFDLSLRPRPRQLEQPRLVRQVRELTAQALLGADAGDSVLVRADIPPEFLEQLYLCGVPEATLLSHPQVDTSAQFRPFGWNLEAMDLNRLHDRPAAHPPIEIVRRVNSRSFTLELAHELDPDAPQGIVVHDPAELETSLSRVPATGAWVIKAEHGNAGLANRVLRQPHLEPADLRFVEERLSEDDCLVVEPWLPRETDWCVVFEVPFDAASFRLHETVCTADGALIGALFEPAEGPPPPGFDEHCVMAEQVAARLAREGYFGPVCVDAFHWRDGDQTVLRSLVDLNGRLSMSDAAHRLWQRLAPERTLLYRFFNRRKLDLPIDTDDLLAALAEHRYDPVERRGILLATPLRFGAGDDAWRPGKIAFLILADHRSGVFELEQRFRERFEV